MRKVIYFGIIGVMMLLFCGTLKAQQRSTGWQLSLGGGFMNYYGDVSPYRIQKWSDWKQAFKFFQYNKYYVPKASFGISLEKRLTPTTGFMIQANKGVFAMSDRYRTTDGSYDQNAPNFNRALNFKTNVFDAGIAFAFHSDNGKFLYSNAFLAPYAFIGAGMTYFNVKGDLYDNEGKPYNYADPNVQPDGKYETKLRPLMTETSKKYSNVVPYADLGIGIKFRFSRVVSLTIQSDIKYSFSDYLDDVSGKYKTNYPSPEQAYAAHPGTNVIGPERNRGYDNGVNDIYIFNKASLQFSLGSHSGRSHFKAPIVYQPGVFTSQKTYGLDTLSQATEDSLRNVHKEDSLMAAHKRDSLKQSITKSTSSDSIQNLLTQIKTQMQSLRFAHIDQDYLIRQNETRYRIASIKHKRQTLENKLHLTKADSLQMRLYQIKIDSLNIEWKAIQKAREQLRKNMEHTPIVTEYADSTKIMIYKDKGIASEDELPLVGLQRTAKNIDTTGYYQHGRSDTSKMRQADRMQLQHELDSLHKLRDSLQGNYRKTNDTSRMRQNYLKQRQYKLDSLQQLRDSLISNYRKTNDTSRASQMQSYQLQNNANVRKDSIQRATLNRSIDSLRRLHDSIQEVYLSQSIDSLQRVHDSLLNYNQEPNVSKTGNDSLHATQLKRSIDSLQRVHDSLQNHYRETNDTSKVRQTNMEQAQFKSEQSRLTKDSLQEIQLNRSIDSLQRVRDSLQSNYQDTTANKEQKENFVQRLFGKSKKTEQSNNKEQDTTTQQQQQIERKQEEIDSLSNEIKALNKNNPQNETSVYDRRIDSLKEVRNSLKNKDQDSTVNQKQHKNFVQRLFGKSENDKQPTSNAKDTISQQQQQIERKQKTIDSLSNEINTLSKNNAQNVASVYDRRIDSLKRVQDSLQNNYQNTTVNQKQQKNFIQRTFGKSEKNKKRDNRDQDIVANQRQQISENQDEIDRLNDEIEKIKKSNQQNQSAGISESDRRSELLRERYLQQAIDNLNRNQRRNRVEIVPTIAPTIRTGKRSNRNYDKQLEVIRRKLDSLQAKESTSDSTHNPPSDTAMNALYNKIDSLKSIEKVEQEPKKDTQLISLRQKIDSLNQQITNVQKNQTTTSKESIESANSAISNFPVISTYFATGSSNLNTTQINKLRPAAAMAKNDSAITIILKGFTDATGGARINEIISKKRCQSVKDVFVDKFDIGSSRIQIEPHGEAKAASGSNPMQRRVDVSLKKSSK